MMLSHKYNQFNCDLLKIVRRNSNSELYIVSGILLLNIAVCITVAAIYESEKSVPSGINYGLFPEYYNKYSVKLSCYMYIAQLVYNVCLACSLKMGSILFKQGDGESRKRGVYVGSTTEEAVKNGNSRGSVLDVARALEKQGNSMKHGVDVTIQVDRRCSVMAVLEKEVEGLERKTVAANQQLIEGMWW